MLSRISRFYSFCFDHRVKENKQNDLFFVLSTNY